jgi:hypothetical protein
MAELCASTGARVEIGETAAGLVWVRIGASAPASGLAVLWTALGAAADADACGAGLPLLPLLPPGTAPSALIPPSVLQATQAASGAQIAASADVVLMSAHKGALHTALLLLLRDALGVAACTTREALLFTAFPPTLARLRQSLTELLPAAAASTCLMVEPIRTAASGCAGSEADLHYEWGARRAVMWAERAHFEAAAELVARAGRGSQTLHAVRAALPATVLSIPPPPPPPLPALLGGQLAEAEARLRRRLVLEMIDGGVTCEDPSSVYLEPGIEVGEETVIRANTHLRGKTRIGRGCVVGPNSILTDATIGDGANVVASVIDGVSVEPGSRIGPFSNLCSAGGAGPRRV